MEKFSVWLPVLLTILILNNSGSGYLLGHKQLFLLGLFPVCWIVTSQHLSVHPKYLCILLWYNFIKKFDTWDGAPQISYINLNKIWKVGRLIPWKQNKKNQAFFNVEWRNYSDQHDLCCTYSSGFFSRLLLPSKFSLNNSTALQTSRTEK